MTGVCLSHLMTRRIRLATRVTPSSSPSKTPIYSESLAIVRRDADVQIQIHRFTILYKDILTAKVLCRGGNGQRKRVALPRDPPVFALYFRPRGPEGYNPATKLKNSL